MNLKECVLENQKCEDIVLYCVDTNETFLVKNKGEWLVNKESILEKRVNTSTRVGNEKIVIEYYKWR